MTGVQTCALPISFVGNAASAGGGIYNLDSLTYLSNCLIWKNAALYDDKEITNAKYQSAQSIIEISHCDIVGGINGVYNYSQCSTVDLGGNIDLNPLFINSPIATYRTSSSGTMTTIELYTLITSSLFVTNVIEINNDGVPRTVTHKSGTTITFTPALDAPSANGSIVHNWGFDATNLVFDLQLQLSSPCIDAGTSDGAPATDILGVERPQGSGVDMGAYEQ